MIEHDTGTDAAKELIRAGGVLRRANVFFLVELAKIVDIASLREGDDEDDYFVDVPVSRLREVGLQVADLHYEVSHRFDAEVRAMTIPVPG